jgi:NADH-quinone oxidoreductase subunit F
MKKLKSFGDFDTYAKKQRERKEKERNVIAICGGTGCIAYGSRTIVSLIEREIKKHKLSTKYRVLVTGCHGFCERGPLVVIRPEGILYQRVKPEDVGEIVADTLVNGKVIERLLYDDPLTGQKIVHEDEVPFYRKQQRIIFGSNGLISPTSIDDYISIGGYSGLVQALSTLDPEEVIDEIRDSGLRGRGGGGFPTGMKWDSCRNASSSDGKYVICNADEGDPGAYMDRSVLEGNPHSVLEGMIIGAYAIGAHNGYIYVREEYPLAVTHFRKALEDAEKLGLLGKDILGTGFDFDVRVNRGGGAFICGESTALMASLEGRVGEPRAKHVHTVVRGVWDSPSNLNNVETWSNVPLIIRKGAEWYRKIGTEGSKGTKIFSLVGKVNNTGLVEVPMGITLREVIYEIGGGIKGGKAFKAVQTGGPSGGCLPASMLDLVIDFDRLSEAGSMMGSGGMIVMDEGNCMVELARYFVAFLKDESCGKCTPCREGLTQMLEILTRICEGRAEMSDLDLLEELAWVVQEGSLCQLGATAPNPVLSTLRYFRREYEEHIRDRKCSAGVCKALIHYEIDPKKCTGCTLCAKGCPQEAITGEAKKPHTIVQERCIRCGICLDRCKFDAVTVS